jgi:hypothetical protein
MTRRAARAALPRLRALFARGSGWRGSTGKGFIREETRWLTSSSLPGAKRRGNPAECAKLALFQKRGRWIASLPLAMTRRAAGAALPRLRALFARGNGGGATWQRLHQRGGTPAYFFAIARSEATRQSSRMRKGHTSSKRKHAGLLLRHCEERKRRGNPAECTKASLFQKGGTLAYFFVIARSVSDGAIQRNAQRPHSFKKEARRIVSSSLLGAKRRGNPAGCAKATLLQKGSTLDCFVATRNDGEGAVAMTRRAQRALRSSLAMPTGPFRPRERVAGQHWQRLHQREGMLAYFFVIARSEATRQSSRMRKGHTSSKRKHAGLLRCHSQ